MLLDNWEAKRRIDRAIGPPRDEDAWTDLVEASRSGLLGVAAGVARQVGLPRHLADELVQNFWDAVVEREYELLRRYDPARGTPLISYLATELRNQAWHERDQRQAYQRLVARCAARGGGAETS